MPQLMTNIWFNVLILAWVVFLVILIPKMMNFKFLNSITPSQHAGSQPSTTPWDWTWQ
uniref:ATP synthase complex subunit 8 n=1 Tax=Acanthaphritis unoorum TaxID=270607 RepID=A0A1V1FTG6_9TELE|nr:ATP synthase F0 subunit 8 [Acanthaphritis unoorum]BAX03894.1 ATPase subunit 8 [Acanthaphritis unoorum]BBU26076.1 ATPase subunit 8 [Acanthaphritis unoorum]